MTLPLLPPDLCFPISTGSFGNSQRRCCPQRAPLPSPGVRSTVPRRHLGLSLFQLAACIIEVKARLVRSQKQLKSLLEGPKPAISLTPPSLPLPPASPAPRIPLCLHPLQGLQPTGCPPKPSDPSIRPRCSRKRAPSWSSAALLSHRGSQNSPNWTKSALRISGSPAQLLLSPS